MDVARDAAQVVGAKASRQRGEARGGSFLGDRIAEAAAVADEAKKETDARKRCLRLLGRGR